MDRVRVRPGAILPPDGGFLCLRQFLCLAALSPDGVFFVPCGTFASGGVSPSATSVPPLDHVRVRPGAILLPYGNFFMPPAVFRLTATGVPPPDYH